MLPGSGIFWVKEQTLQDKLPCVSVSHSHSDRREHKQPLLLISIFPGGIQAGEGARDDASPSAPLPRAAKRQHVLISCWRRKLCRDEVFCLVRIFSSMHLSSVLPLSLPWPFSTRCTLHFSISSTVQNGLNLPGAGSLHAKVLGRASSLSEAPSGLFYFASFICL